jgi:uncharacterized protein YbjT (DUF2867 family)
MDVIVFGAQGLVGRSVVAEALARGHLVTAVGDEDDPPQGPHDARLRVVRADVLNPLAYDFALAGQDAVIFALDFVQQRDVNGVHSQGVRRVLDAMAAHGVGRIVCLSTAMEDPQSAGPSIFRRLVARRAVGALDDVRRMEVLVRSSDAQWTIVRPARVVAAAGRARFREGPGYAIPGGSKIAADDVAAFMLNQLESNRYVGHAVAIAW